VKFLECRKFSVRDFCGSVGLSLASPRHLEETPGLLVKNGNDQTIPRCCTLQRHFFRVFLKDQGQPPLCRAFSLPSLGFPLRFPFFTKGASPTPLATFRPPVAIAPAPLPFETPRARFPMVSPAHLRLLFSTQRSALPSTIPIFRTF